MNESDLKVASSYSKRSGDAEGGQITAHRHTPACQGATSPLSPQVPKVPKAVAKRKSNCSFHGCNGSPFTNKHVSNPIKCVEIDVNFNLQFHHNLCFWIPNTLNIRYEKKDWRDQCKTAVLIITKIHDRLKLQRPLSGHNLCANVRRDDWTTTYQVYSYYKADALRFTTEVTLKIHQK